MENVAIANALQLWGRPTPRQSLLYASITTPMPSLKSLNISTGVLWLVLHWHRSKTERKCIYLLQKLQKYGLSIADIRIWRHLRILLVCNLVKYRVFPQLTWYTRARAHTHTHTYTVIAAYTQCHVHLCTQPWPVRIDPPRSLKDNGCWMEASYCVWRWYVNH